MKATRPRNIQTRLFFTFSIIIISVLVIITGIFYFWMSSQLKSRASSDIQQSVATMSQKIDDEINNMDNVSMNVCYSNIVKDQFENYAITSKNGVRSDSAKELTDLITAIIGPNFSVQQIFLYNFNGKVFGTGFDNRQMNVSIQKKRIYKEIVNKKGSMLISTPQKNASLSSIISTSNEEIYFVSLYRLYYDKFNAPQGVVEVVQYASNIFSDLSSLDGSNTLGEKIYVFNGSGSQIYPYSESIKSHGNYYYQLCKSKKTKNFEAISPYSHKMDLFSYTTSDYTGFTTIVVSDENTILSSFGTFTLYTVIVTVMILLIALLFSFYAAKAFTKPIRTLRHNMHTIASHDQLGDIPDLGSNLTELEELNESFRHMNKKIKTSTDELLLSQKNEMSSKMLALQSQMNPHFLYNSLATISAMAEENLDSEIVKMCDNMCDMLRYISSDISKSVSLATEISNVLKYVECMRLRFGERLSCTVNMVEGLSNIQIPKLVIQPLVENAIRYASLTSSLVTISVSGTLSDGCWRIAVKDNGLGFSEEALDRLHAKISEIERTGLMPSLEIDGMGLINIYIRLKLMYKEKAFFNIRSEKNMDEPIGHTIVEIGGLAVQYGEDVI